LGGLLRFELLGDRGISINYTVNGNVRHMHRHVSSLSVWYNRRKKQLTPLMKYPLHTQSQPVSGEAAKKLLAAIDSGSSIVNDRVLAVAKRIAARRRRTQKNG
jgi:hypothetical protein